jgi:thiol:disulfide interchange protein DsbD
MLQTIFASLSSALQTGTISSSLMAILLAYFGGIISSFTPCIYPVIPITVGFIGGASEKSIKAGWVMSSFYVLGMAAVYTVLGLIASFSGKIFGSFTNTSSWYLFIGFIMVFSSLWMLDVIKFDLNVWLSRLNKKKLHTKNSIPGIVERNEGTILGAFLLGGSSGFIAAPCTTPVLTTILAYIANEKSLAFGSLLMFAFALGLGTILVFIGTFTGALKLLPKSGKWLNTVKVFSGLLILALGQYFVYKAGTLK